MSSKASILLSTAAAMLCIFPAHAESQYIRVDGDAVHIQNGGQELHIDKDGVQIDVSGDTAIDRSGEDTSYEQPSHVSSGVDFTNADLTKQSFAGRDLRGANFTNATLKNVSFRNADLTDANFTNAELVDCDLRGADVTGADFTNASFTGSFIKGVDFSRATMTNVDMSGADQTSFIPTSSESIARALTHPTEKGKPAFVNLSITFDFDKADVSTEGLDQIKELARALQSDSLSSARLMIEGHTDSKGSDEYNMDLSRRRAEAIIAVLTSSHDIAPARLKAAGYGEMRPVAENDTDFGRAQNRRVTIINMGK